MPGKCLGPYAGCECRYTSSSSAHERALPGVARSSGGELRHDREDVGRRRVRDVRLRTLELHDAADLPGLRHRRVPLLEAHASTVGLPLARVQPHFLDPVRHEAGERQAGAAQAAEVHARLGLKREGDLGHPDGSPAGHEAHTPTCSSRSFGRPSW